MYIKPELKKNFEIKSELLRGVSLIDSAYDSVPPDGYNVIATFAEALGYILEKEGKYDIVYRGTRNRSDVLTDMDILTKDIGVGHVHLGAWEKYQLVHETVIDFATQLKPGIDLSIFGHSMGTWLNYLTADQLHQLKPKVFQYAPPRFCNLNYKYYFNSLNLQVTAVASKNDRVPLFPIEFFHVVDPMLLTFEGIGELDELSNHAINNFPKAITNTNWRV